jgi:hypothetical protein
MKNYKNIIKLIVIVAAVVTVGIFVYKKIEQKSNNDRAEVIIQPVAMTASKKPNSQSIQTNLQSQQAALQQKKAGASSQLHLATQLKQQPKGSNIIIGEGTAPDTVYTGSGAHQGQYIKNL